MFFISDPRKHPLRTAILVIAIGSSLALFFLLSSLSIGIRESSKEAVEKVGSDVYVVPESLNPLLVDLQSFDQGWAVINELRSYSSSFEASSPRLKRSLFYRTGELDIDEAMVYGIVPGAERDFHQFKITGGTWFDIDEDPIRDTYISRGEVNGSLMTGELLISEAMQRRTGLSPGDVVGISARIETEQPYQFMIKGIFLDALSKSSETMLVHLGELQYIKGMLERDTLTEILLSYGDDVDLDELVDWSLGDDFLFRDNVDLYLKEDLLFEVYKFMSILDGFSIMVITVTLLVCLIFTSTIFMISTKQRSLELAVLRAIGFRPLRIFHFVIRESVVIYALGSAAGIALGFVMAAVLNSGIQGLVDGLPSDFHPFSMEPYLIGFTILAAFVLSLISALVPAFISSRRSPVEVIRGEL
ncbi:MAG: FtsX-like permease family protein [Thermoplasmatota archaeon]